LKFTTNTTKRRAMKNMNIFKSDVNIIDIKRTQTGSAGKGERERKESGNTFH